MDHADTKIAIILSFINALCGVATLIGALVIILYMRFYLWGVAGTFGSWATVFSVVLLIGWILYLPVVVSNWIGTFRLKSKPLGWGIYFLVTGIIFGQLLSIITGGLLLVIHFRRTNRTRVAERAP